MRRLWAAIALFVALFGAPAMAGPDDYVFEFRLLDEDGREIVATCRGRAPCVLDELPARLGGVNFAAEVITSAAGIEVAVRGHGARLELQEVSATGVLRGGREWPRRASAFLAELPAVLRVDRYEEHGAAVCLEDGWCSRPRRLVGSGHLMIRPLSPALGPSHAR